MQAAAWGELVRDACEWHLAQGAPVGETVSEQVSRTLFISKLSPEKEASEINFHAGKPGVQNGIKK